MNDRPYPLQSCRAARQGRPPTPDATANPSGGQARGPASLVVATALRYSDPERFPHAVVGEHRWNTDELLRNFRVIGFAATYVAVVR
jgi:hypothetical protein